MLFYNKCLDNTLLPEERLIELVNETDVLTVGGIVVDELLIVEHMPTPGECLRIRGLRTLAGGSANLAIVASRLGLRTASIDVVGSDDAGRTLLSILRDENIDISFMKSKNGVTKRVLLLVDAKYEKAFINLFTESMAVLTPNDINEEVIKATKSIYITGLSFGADIVSSTEGDSALRAIEIAREHGKLVFFDPGPFIKSIEPKVLDKVLENTDMLSLNLEEASSIISGDEPGEIARELHGKGPWIIAMKMGERGCLLSINGRHYREPGIKINAIDTTGAGDAFNAALLYGFLRGLKPDLIVKLANMIGALATTKLGAGQNLPTRQEIIYFLHKNQNNRLLEVL